MLHGANAVEVKEHEVFEDFAGFGVLLGYFELDADDALVDLDDLRASVGLREDLEGLLRVDDVEGMHVPGLLGKRDELLRQALEEVVVDLVLLEVADLLVGGGGVERGDLLQVGGFVDGGLDEELADPAVLLGCFSLVDASVGDWDPSGLVGVFVVVHFVDVSGDVVEEDLVLVDVLDGFLDVAEVSELAALGSVDDVQGRLEVGGHEEDDGLDGCGGAEDDFVGAHAHPEEGEELGGSGGWGVP